MRGRSGGQRHFFYSFDIEDRIRADHPLRAIKAMVDQDLGRMSRLFSRAYSGTGRPSVPPERLLKAMLLQALYSIRSERQLVERIDTDLLFRWFLDMDPAEDVFDATALTHNRRRLDQFGITAIFFGRTVKRALNDGLASDDHFSVDGTLIESHGSIKRFVPKDQLNDEDDRHNGDGVKSRNTAVDFHGQKRSNATHVSRTDPEARLYKKATGQAAKLCHMGHAISDNRHGLVLAVAVSQANGRAESEAALAMLDDLGKRHRVVPKTIGADKGYDSGALLLALERRSITPHIPVRANAGGCKHARASRDQAAIAARQRMQERSESVDYRLSQKSRKRVEEVFGWIKRVAGLARSQLVGRWKLRQQFEMAAAAYNLVRISRLLSG